MRAFADGDLPRILAVLGDGHGATAVAQQIGAGLVRSVGFRGVRAEIRGPDGRFGWLFDDGSGEVDGDAAGEAGEHGDESRGGAAERRGATSSGGRARMSARWHGAARPWIDLLASAAELVELAADAADLALEVPAPATLDAAMARLEGQLERIADGDLAVLVRGESGTGKEVIARRLHALSGGPFIDLNCAALPRDLLESELFGVESGVATGVEARPGRFELAHGGSLFLDEIGDMAADTQAKLLRVLQEGEVYRLGGEKPRPARPRVIAATNLDLRALLGGRFRADLFHRLCGFESLLPPLRERRADVVNLAACFLQRFLARRGLASSGLSPEAAHHLRRCPWPGNIRQLQREMARAALFLERGERLEVSRLSVAPRAEDEDDLPLAEHLERVERRILAATLDDCGGDATRAASELGVARSTFYRRLKEHGLEAPP